MALSANRKKDSLVLISKTGEKKPLISLKFHNLKNIWIPSIATIYNL